MINKRYKIIEKLGEGRSRVFRCANEDSSGKEIAIKILSGNSDVNEKKLFREEFFTLRRLKHPNIAACYDTGTVLLHDHEYDINTGDKFFTLEYINGLTLLDYYKNHDEELLKQIIVQICSALHYLHQSNFIYYDLKPENILISEQNGKPLVKFIDLGLAEYSPSTDDFIPRGTAEYIAPEILKKEKHDYRVDIYSLGMMLFRLIYGKFPFDTNSEMDIYKFHLEGEINFPDTGISSGLHSVLVKTLEKDPEKRLFSPLQVLGELGVSINKEMIEEFVPAKIFTNRRDTLTILKKYIEDEETGEVFTIKGFEGTGKTFLTEQIQYLHHTAVLIRNSDSGVETEFLNSFLKALLFNEIVFNNLTEETRKNAELFLSKNSDDKVEEFKLLVNKISVESFFLLVFDGFNAYDGLEFEVLKHIIPLLQINGIKIILTEESELDYTSGFISNLRELNLTPFTEANLSEYMEKCFYDRFPKQELKKQIMLYADLVPGSIDSFIKDIMLLNIIKFSPDKIEILLRDKDIKLLRSSHLEIYNIRLGLLSEVELKAAEILSAFDTAVSQKALSVFMGCSKELLNRILESLQKKNIIQKILLDEPPVFTSTGLKKFIYDRVENKNSLHSQLADSAVLNVTDLPKAEIARQYECAGRFEDAYQILMQAVEEAGNLSAYSYQKKLLEHLESLPISQEEIKNVKLKLAAAYTKLNDAKSTIKKTNELLEINLTPDQLYDVMFLKGKSLLETGEIQEGRDLLQSVVEQIDDEKKFPFLVEIAYAEFDLNNIDKASELCNTVVNHKLASLENKGRCYNLLGLISILNKFDIEGGLDNFNKALTNYQEAGSILDQAKMEMNIGNTFAEKSDFNNAEQCWQKAIDKNASVGNLDQEGKILQNYGVYFNNRGILDEATKKYKRAYDIFTTVGNKTAEGLVLNNMGENYLKSCDYENAFKCLVSAQDIFKRLQNSSEEGEVLFMTGNFYFNLRESNGLKDCIRQYSELISSNDLTGRHLLNINLLEFYLLFCTEPGQIQISDVRTLKEKLLEQESWLNYIRTQFLLAELYIQNKMISNLFEELNDEDFLNRCAFNNLDEAERLYLLGHGAEIDRLPEMNATLDYLLKAFDILTEESICETTWRVLYAIGHHYLQRGNIIKAKEHITYCCDLIDFIASNIESREIKKYFLNREDVKLALSTVNTFQEK